ncbi:MAG: MFS transporter [Oscillospiraceae bacterium]|jgi:MFS family permease
MSSRENSLWTKDFTIITVGTVVSMFGNALSGFAASLLVLDYTGSTLLYAVTVALYTLPQIVMPVISGAILDRFSRRKTIYTLDFTSSALYLAAAILIYTGVMSYALLAVYVFLVGSIASIYQVAYDSFYPLLVEKDSYSKAYSIASVLETISLVMVPVAAWLYDLVGIVPIFLINACTFLIAAVMETQISAGHESYIDRQKEKRTESSSVRQMFSDIKEGASFIKNDRGLRSITIYFAFGSVVSGIYSVLILPYFRANFENGEYVYMAVMGMGVLGRALGGAWHYRHKLPAEKKYSIAYAVYLITSIIEGVMLFLPVKVMYLITFASGVLGVTSYTIRISATQSYVADEMKGRFNGAFSMINTAGALIGELSSGALSTVMDTRWIMALYMFLHALTAYFFIGRNREAVSAIYNRD